MFQTNFYIVQGVALYVRRLLRPCLTSTRTMVLDLTLFRKEKGGNPDEIRESQTKRFKDVSLVDKVIDIDTKWREISYHCDQYNKLKNLTSKAIGKKMKAKEPLGDSDEVSEEAKANLLMMTMESMDKFTVKQLKVLSLEIDNRKKSDAAELVKLEEERLHNLRQVVILLTWGNFYFSKFLYC